MEAPDAGGKGTPATVVPMGGGGKGGVGVRPGARLLGFRLGRSSGRRLGDVAVVAATLPAGGWCQFGPAQPPPRWMGGHPRVRARRAGRGTGALPATAPAAPTRRCDWVTASARRRDLDAGRAERAGRGPVEVQGRSRPHPAAGEAGGGGGRNIGLELPVLRQPSEDILKIPSGHSECSPALEIDPESDVVVGKDLLGSPIPFGADINQGCETALRGLCEAAH